MASSTSIALEPSLGQRLLTAQFMPATPRPQLIETHISWVILGGEFVYKVKKPVRFDFLDYSTLEKRNYYCQRELEIGKRYAPSIYVDVVPIRSNKDQLEVGGTQGPIVDYAVRMRQFDQACLLDRLLTAGQVASSEMDALAAQLARYHAEAARVSLGSDAAALRAIQPALDNFEYLLSHLSDPQSVSGLGELQSWTLRQADALRDWFAERAAAGFVRDCHGDLHLNNLLRIDGRFLAFDAIEFNDQLSQIDTINEVAFLAMELHEHGFPAHAHRFINQYLEEANDYGALRGLRFYLVYRAMVRAKVDLIRHTQTTGSPRTNLTEAGERYVQFARRIATPTTPSLWIMHGFSGSGKSTIAMRLVEERGLIRLRSDVIRKQLLGIDPLQKTPEARLGEAYSADLTARVYTRLAELSQQVLSAGFDAIADATFLKRSQRQRFAELAARLGVPFQIVDCSAPIAELQHRLTQRGPDPSDATLSVLQHQIATAEPLDSTEQLRLAH
jgi:aminoglycoside phosphotransferase family enzyme/predicted kinase